MRDFFAALGVPSKADHDDLKRAWLPRVSSYRPDRDYDGVIEDYIQAQEAYRVLSDADLRPEYDQMGHVEWLLNHPMPTYPQDWAPLYLRNALMRGENLRFSHAELTATDLEVMGEELEALPDYVRGERFEDVAEFNLGPVIAELIELPELAALGINEDPRRFRVVWRRTPWVKQGALVLGSCRVLPAKERALWRGEGPVPLWELTFNLPAWCLQDPEERVRLVHHELAHAEFTSDKPSVRPHALEEHLETVARFGPANRGEAQLVWNAFNHPAMKHYILERGWNPVEGKGLLFGPGQQRAVEQLPDLVDLARHPRPRAWQKPEAQLSIAEAPNFRPGEVRLGGITIVREGRGAQAPVDAETH